MAAAGNNLHVIAENGDVIIFIFQPRDYYAELLQTPIPPDTPAPGTIVIRVQASLDAVQRHSAYFRELLQGQEPGATPAANQMQITDCDPELFLLAMRAVHGKSYLELPLGLDQLARLAFIVDRYKLHDVMRHYTDSQCIRVESILFTMGQINIVDLEKWIFICWVLSKHQRLNTAVRVAIKTAIFPLSSLAVPLTEHLVEFVEQHRVRAIAAIQESWNARLKALSETHQKTCTRSDDCDYQQFGALATLAKVTQLNYPPTQSPYLCISVAAILDVVRKFKFPECPGRVGHNFECPTGNAPCQCAFECEVGLLTAQTLSRVQNEISRVTYLYQGVA